VREGEYEEANRTVTLVLAFGGLLLGLGLVAVLVIEP
jgi:hypothetical protein